ncbi:MAG: hypothetical protein AABZ00_13495 [Chloroflexota bacterium]
MEKPITFKPIFWRLIMWRTAPLLLGYVIGYFSQNWNYESLLIMASVILVVAALDSVIFGQKFIVTISKDSISGIRGTGITWHSETFFISDLDRSSVYKQSLFENILGIHTLCSRNGQKIALINFIYGKSTINEIQKMVFQ